MNTAVSEITISDVIDSHPISRMQFCAIAICILTVVLDGFDTQIIGMLAPVISRDIQVPVASFGPIFSAGLFGMLLGAVLLGPLADRYGRKALIVVACALFGSLSLATAYVQTYDQLLVLRFLTGVGLGGALPNAIALASEYAPRRHSRTVVACLMCGMPLGAVLGGVVSSMLIPVHGWHSVFLIGGALPLLVALAAMRFLNESPGFLVLRDGKQKQLNRIVQHIAPELVRDAMRYVRPATPARVPLRELFSRDHAVPTLLLWIPYFMNLVVLYFVVSWMPAVLSQAQDSVALGIRSVTLFSLGGIIGCLMQGPMMNRFGMRTVLVSEMLVFIVLAVALAMNTGNANLVLIISVLMGVAVQGAQAGLNAIATEIYPVHMRATGVGCAVGVGRLGSISGPLAGGLLLGWDWNVGEVFLAGIIPALIATIAIALNKGTRKLEAES